MKTSLRIAVLTSAVIAGMLVWTVTNRGHDGDAIGAQQRSATGGPVDEAREDTHRNSAAADWVSDGVQTPPVAPPATDAPQPRVNSSPQPRSTKERPALTGPPRPTSAPTKRTPKPVADPIAREALAYVGSDSAAEEYWLEAINDGNIPPHERQDLIEDLNEDGLSDPKHPTQDDLPLIVNRLMLIESVAEDAIDQVNADAFQEAYKDLLQLAEVAARNGAN